MIGVDLAGPADFPGWRDAARRLAQADVPPEDVVWRTGEGKGDLFGGDGTLPTAPDAPRALRVPRRFLDLAELAVCHKDPERFGLLYRLLLRMQDEAGLIEVTTEDMGLQGQPGPMPVLCVHDTDQDRDLPGETAITTEVDQESVGNAVHPHMTTATRGDG